MNYYRRFPGDYGRDTQHLTFEQHGAYALLLDICYNTEKPLPFDRDLIYRMTRAISPSDRAAIDLVIKQFFTKSRWGFIQKRVCEEIKYLESRVKAARANGKHGGRPKTKAKPSGLAKQEPTRNPEKSSPDYQTTEASSLAFSQDTSSLAFTLQGADAPIVSLPTWLAFVEMRKKIRKPLTQHGGELIRRELQHLKDQGQDPEACLEQSIANSYAGVFALKGGSNGKVESFAERRSKSNAAAITRVLGRPEEALGDLRRGLPTTNK